jgi:Ser/Thr protein kinase RdoA (MazF antagonist)
VNPPDTDSVLRTACKHVGLDAAGAQIIRLGENALYRLANGVVARVSRAGQTDAATKEVNVARWLHSIGIAAVEVASDVEQPVVVDDRAVTFWLELAEHRNGTPVEVATALRMLHAVEPPTAFTLPNLAPFVRLSERIAAAVTLSSDDRQWMRAHLADLRRRYDDLPAGLPPCVVHGDAWVGNVVSANGATLFLDLERVSIGPPEWDLVHTAIKHSSFGWITAADYASFAGVYGHDVTNWDGFTLLRDVREFRMTCMAAQVAATNPASVDQAAHRLACLRGLRGVRPWPDWRAVP